MSEQKPQNLIDLSKEELVEKVMKARKIYRNQNNTIENLTHQCARTSEQLKELSETDGKIDGKIAELEAQLNESNANAEQGASYIATLESKIEAQDKTIKELQEVARGKDAYIDKLTETLQKAGEIALDTVCRAKHTYTIVEPFHKVKD